MTSRVPHAGPRALTQCSPGVGPASNSQLPLSHHDITWSLPFPLYLHRCLHGEANTGCRGPHIDNAPCFPTNRGYHGEDERPQYLPINRRVCRWLQRRSRELLDGASAGPVEEPSSTEHKDSLPSRRLLPHLPGRYKGRGRRTRPIPWSMAKYARELAGLGTVFSVLQKHEGFVAGEKGEGGIFVLGRVLHG